MKIILYKYGRHAIRRLFRFDLHIFFLQIISLSSSSLSSLSIFFCRFACALPNIRLECKCEDRHKMLEGE